MNLNKIFTILIFSLLISNISFSQSEEEQMNNTIVFKNGEKIIGDYQVKATLKNRIKICKSNSNEDCKEYNKSDIKFVKFGLSKKDIKTNEKRKNKISRGKKAKELITPTVIRYFKYGNKYFRFYQAYKGESFEFYKYSEPRGNNGYYERMIVTEPNYGKWRYKFSNYSSRKKMLEVFSNIDCPALKTAIKGKKYKMARKKLPFFKIIDKCGS